MLITGGTTGIGRATSILLASRGARLVVFGREQDPLNVTIDTIKKAGGEAYGLTADTAKQEDIKRVVEFADQKLGNIDVVISNAALGAGSIVESSFEEQDYVVRTNLLGYMLVAKEAVQRMQKRKQGQILFVGSMSAVVREGGSSLYVATKSGIEGLAEALRKEVNDKGIRVALIEPGEVGTDMNELPPEKQREKQAQLGQLKAEDIADTVYYILTRPKRVDVVEIRVRPHLQKI